MKLLALLCAALPICSLADEVDAITGPPWTYNDGSPMVPMTYAWRSGCVARGQYERPVEVGTEPSHTYKDLPDAVCYFAVSVRDTGGNESPLAANGGAWDGVRNLIVPPTPTAAATGTPAYELVPTPSVSVSLTIADNNVALGLDELDLIVVGAADVTLDLGSGNCVDWISVGAIPGGPPTSNMVPTIPDTGRTNNDGVPTEPTQTVRVRGPILKAHMDLDCTGNFTAGTATVAGVTKPLVRSGNVWAVSF